MRHSHLTLLLSAAVLLCCWSCGQGDKSTPAGIETGSCWFDGYEFFVCTPDTASPDSLFLFQGGTLHEGGSAFALRIVASDTFNLEPIPGADWVSMGIIGDCVVRGTANGQPCLLFIHPDGSGTDTLWQFDPGDKQPIEAYGTLLYEKHLKELAGTYTDPKSKTVWQFADSLLIRTTPKGRTDTVSFSLFYEWDMPSHTLIFSDKKNLWYEKTAEGIDLYRVRYIPESEVYSREGKYISLTRQ